MLPRALGSVKEIIQEIIQDVITIQFRVEEGPSGFGRDGRPFLNTPGCGDLCEVRETGSRTV
jgi:hypothetical protein